ncbi:MAG: SIR2 family protein [Anaerolineaceae bacterium]|nr:SIR2 family protein [Anaerolineaceae bacterium]
MVICPWNEEVEQVETIFDREPKYEPSPDRPLVYHLFGRFDFPESLVIREDHYFDYLVGIAKNWDLVPIKVREAFANTSLLFVGFQLDEWDFRVIHRSLRAQLGSKNNSNNSVGVQVDLEGGEIQEPERARRYLENYYRKSADLSLFWGSPDEFMQELAEKWEKPA